PRSTSASPPPNTTANPALVSALSIGPCRFSVEPKLPVQSCVPLGANHDNEVIAIKPALNAISGSLLPKGNSKGVFENVSVPAVVPAIWGNAVETGAAAAAGAAAAVTVIVAVALFMVSLTEVAVSVTVAGFGTAVGAL